MDRLVLVIEAWVDIASAVLSAVAWKDFVVLISVITGASVGIASVVRDTAVLAAVV